MGVFVRFLTVSVAVVCGACRTSEPLEATARVRPVAASVVDADFHRLTVAAEFEVAGVDDPASMDDAEIAFRVGGRILAAAPVAADPGDEVLRFRAELPVDNEAVAAAVARADLETVTGAVVFFARDRRLSAASTLEVPVLRPPTIELAEVRLQDHGPLEATLAIDLRITNPNPWPIDFKRLVVVPRVDGSDLAEVLFDLIGRLVFDGRAARLTVLATTRFTGEHAQLYNLIGKKGPHDVAVRGRAVFDLDGPISPLEAEIDDAGRFSW